MSVTRLVVWELEPFIDAVVKKQSGKLAQVNVPFLSNAWRGLLENNVGIAFAIYNGETPAGFLLGLFTNDMITGDLYAIQYLWMVDPEYRPGGTALRLYDAFEKEAQFQKCKRVLGGCNHVYKPQGMRELFLRRGYLPFSEAFYKDLK